MRAARSFARVASAACHHITDESVAQGCLRIDHVTGEQQLRRALRAHEPRQAVKSAEIGDEPPFHEELSEPGPL